MSTSKTNFMGLEENPVITVNFNSTNVISYGGGNAFQNGMRINLPSTLSLKGLSCTLKIIETPYSFPSFTSASYFTYTWIDGSVNNVPIPKNSTLEISDLQLLLESVMITNGHYLVDGAGNNQYYISFYANPIYYRVTFQSIPFPTSLPAGWSNPNAISFPANPTYVQVTFLDPAICGVVGFNPGTYPSAQTPAANIYTVNGQNCPEVTPYSCIQILTDFVCNPQSYPAQMLNQFPIAGVAYGGIISYEPRFPTWMGCSNNNTNSLTLWLADQNGNGITVLDPNWVVQIQFKKTNSFQ